GSVGIETQQINLVATIPFVDSWFKRQDGIFASLKGQVLQIPVSGTLTAPRLDTSVLQNVTKLFAGSAVRGVLEKQFERGLQGLQGSGTQGTAPQGADGLLQRGENLLQGELGQGLRGLFGPKTPAPSPPPATPPR